MKSLNMERKMDDVGRVSVPKPIRDKYNIETGLQYPLFTYTDKNGRLYICIQTNYFDLSEMERAAKVLEKIGCEIPDELADILIDKDE